MRLKPDYNLNSIYDINPKELVACGVKAVFFDLDSTVMKSKSGILTEKTCEFLDALGQSLKIAIVTNNNNKEYIEKVCSNCSFKVYADAKKPDVKVLNQAMKDFGVSACESVFVGDRPLTDILVGKKAGMLTILVDSISKEEEHPIVRAVRRIERLAIK